MKRFVKKTTATYKLENVGTVCFFTTLFFGMWVIYEKISNITLDPIFMCFIAFFALAWAIIFCGKIEKQEFVEED